MSEQHTQLEFTMIGCDMQTRPARDAIKFSPDEPGKRQAVLQVKLDAEMSVIVITIADPDEVVGVLQRWIAYCDGVAPRPKFNLDIARMLIAS